MELYCELGKNNNNSDLCSWSAVVAGFYREVRTDRDQNENEAVNPDANGSNLEKW